MAAIYQDFFIGLLVEKDRKLLEEKLFTTRQTERWSCSHVLPHDDGRCFYVGKYCSECGTRVELVTAIASVLREPFKSVPFSDDKRLQYGKWCTILPSLGAISVGDYYTDSYGDGCMENTMPALSLPSEEQLEEFYQLLDLLGLERQAPKAHYIVH